MNRNIVLACLLLLGLCQDSKPDDPPVRLTAPTPLVNPNPPPASNDPFQGTKLSEAYMAAYAKGRAEAEVALKQGRATIYGFGLTRFAYSLDKETGLAVERIADCEVDDEILGRADGHNERVRDYVTNYLSPVYSMKPWEKELFDLKGYFLAQKAIQPPYRLVLGGPSSKSPNGRYEIRPVPADFKDEDGTPIKAIGYILTVDGKDLPMGAIENFDHPVELVWGPKGSGFFSLSGSSKFMDYYAAKSARTNEGIRAERVAERDQPQM